MANRYSPGCCCDDCRVIDYLAPFTGFGTVEGTHQTEGPFAFPREEEYGGTAAGSVPTRLSMDEADELGPTPAALSDQAAYWHEIEADGDFDLTWEGGTIEYRPSVGTITAGGQTVPILQDGSPRTHSRLVLYVTPTWYGVFAYRLRQIPTAVFPNTRVGSTRSSIQQFDRANDTANTAATLTAAAGGCNVYAWRLGDATVRTTDPAYGYQYGDILSECFRPAVFPMGTERAYQFQTAGTTSGIYSGTYPDTFERTGDTIVDATVNYQCTVEEGPLSFNYNGPIPSSIATGSLTGNNSWQDFIAGAYGDTPGRLTGPGTSINLALATEIVDCCECFGTPFGNYGGGFSFTAFLRINWPAPSPEEPYPKLQQLATLASIGFGPQSLTSATILGPNGKAPATTQNTFTNAPAAANTTIESATVSWSTE